MNERTAIGAALASEIAELSSLAFRSKAHWGYPADWLDEWRPQLTLSLADLDAHEVFVARRDGRPIGFYALALGDTASLEHCWVDPAFIGQGVGRRLVAHALRLASQRGYRVIRIDSDPHAEAFYLRLGAVRVGAIAAPVAGTARELPRLMLEVPG